MERVHNEITRIVITGGPCGGKTAAMERIQSTFDAKGYRVLLVPETATELILGGVTPWERPDFQKIRVARQLEAEENACRMAQEAEEGKLLIVFDRGIADTRAYTTEDEYDTILRQNKLTVQEVMSRYDAVIHLTSAARGAAGHYTLQSNAARTETAAEAAELDDRILDAWKVHPKRVIIPAMDSFEKKMEYFLRVIAEIAG